MENKTNEIEQLKKDFEANMLDGDKIDDCGGTMLSAKDAWEWCSSRLKSEGEKAVKAFVDWVTDGIPNNAVIRCGDLKGKADEFLAKEGDK